MRLTHLLAGACACAFLLAAHAVAQDAEGPKARRAEFIKKYDADGDGKLDEAEREELRRKLQERRG